MKIWVVAGAVVIVSAGGAFAQDLAAPPDLAPVRQPMVEKFLVAARSQIERECPLPELV